MNRTRSSCGIVVLWSRHARAICAATVRCIWGALRGDVRVSSSSRFLWLVLQSDESLVAAMRASHMAYSARPRSVLLLSEAEVRSACAVAGGGVTGRQIACVRLVICDARPRVNAYGNMGRGGGTENIALCVCVYKAVW